MEQATNPRERAILSEEAIAESEGMIRDLLNWADPAPDRKAQAQFLGNLMNKFLRGISRTTIEKMSVRDRVTAARQCYDMRQIELDRPMANSNFQARKTAAEALPELLKEIERRKAERTTINITPHADD
jgi:hypothetical protein